MPRAVGVDWLYREATHQRRLWTPGLLRPALWLDAADLSTIRIATGVSEWRDKSGNGRNVTATGTARPTYVPAGLNGLPLIRFDGTANVMGNSGAALLRQVSGATLILVTRRAANNAVQAAVMGIGTPTATRAAIAYRDGSGAEGVFTGGRRLNADAFQATSASAYRSAYIIVVGVFNYSAATLTLFENGTQTSTRAFQTSGVTDNDGGAFYIGANAVGTGGFFNGDVAEAAVLHSAASRTLREQTEGFLAWKWGLRAALIAGHPFVNRPPLIGG